MIVGCFTLHLYCDSPEHKRTDEDFKYLSQQASRIWDSMHPGEFTGETRHDCVRAARKAGWVLKAKANRAICPIHNNKRPDIKERALEKYSR